LHKEYFTSSAPKSHAFLGEYFSFLAVDDFPNAGLNRPDVELP
jgi:hypothetical protein